MPRTTLTVPRIHCALCRAELVATIQALGGVPVAAPIGGDEVVVDSEDGFDVRVGEARLAWLTHPSA